jgi:hypothetical protein
MNLSKYNLYIVFLLIVSFLSCQNKKAINSNMEEFGIKEFYFEAFSYNEGNLINEKYQLKEDTTYNSFFLLFNQEVIGKIDFQGKEYEGPGYLAYIAETSDESAVILIEATSDIGTAWYYIIIIESQKITKQFFIYEPRSNSESYSLKDFLTISFKQDYIQFKFKKKLISPYSSFPKNLNQDKNFVYREEKLK